MASEAHYDEAYYRRYRTGVGHVVYERNDHWLSFFGGLADEINRRIRPRSALDVGCAIGLLVEAMADRGIDAKGFDYSEYAISQAPASVTDRVWVASATEQIEGHYDLVVSIEVLEHLAPEDASKALARITAVTDTFLLSTTPDDFGEPTHFNVRPPEYWAELLAGFGFYRDLDFDAAFLTPWAALFRRGEPMQSDLVRNYEREAWRLRTETRLVREELNGPSATGATDLSDAVTELRHDLRLALDAAHGAEAVAGNASARLRLAENEVDRLQSRERELEDMVRTASAEMDALNESRLFVVFKKFLRIYSRFRA